MLAFSEGIYNWIKFGHVLTAIVWVGGGIFVQIYVARLRRANEMSRLTAFARDIERLGNALTISRYDLAVLVLVVVDMVIKPGLSRHDRREATAWTSVS